jgi:hypothetical protein
MVYLKIAATFILKIFTFKKGALALLSSIGALFVTFFLQVQVNKTSPTLFDYDSVLNLLLKGAEVRDILLMILIQGGFCFFFTIFTTTDLITGIQNALYFNSIETTPLTPKDVIQSHKLWRTFWKSFGVVTLTMMLTFLAIFAVLSKSTALYWVMIWSLITFWTMACGFEFYSIGENLAKRNNGNKPPIFGFVDKILEAVQRKAISKIDNSFNILDETTTTTTVVEEKDNQDI